MDDLPKLDQLKDIDVVFYYKNKSSYCCLTTYALPSYYFWIESATSFFGNLKILRRSSLERKLTFWFLRLSRCTQKRLNPDFDAIFEAVFAKSTFLGKLEEPKFTNVVYTRMN